METYMARSTAILESGPILIPSSMPTQALLPKNSGKETVITVSAFILLLLLSRLTHRNHMEEQKHY